MKNYNLIKEWMQENGIFYDFNIHNNDHLNDYVDGLRAKLPELYAFLRKNDIVPEHSLQGFMHMIELSLNRALYNKMHGEY